jgi:hypothetical protein
MALTMGSSAFAATDGVLGLTSVGTTIVSITKGDQALITGMLDIALPPWSTGSPAPAGATTACVFSTTGNYQVTTSSANTSGNDYRLTDGFGFIIYTVEWNDGVAGLQPMVGGTALAGQVGDGASQNCGGALPATVAVGIAVGEMNAAAAGAYTDTLTVLIAPE